MRILLTGGTGLIGRHLIPRLLELGHHVTVSTRSPEKAQSRLDARVTLWRGFEDIITSMILMPSSTSQANLSPTNAGRRKQKQRLCHSRWDITQKLVNLFNASDTPPAVLISGSAVGFYGDLGEVVVNEDEPPHNEFTHKLCARWEQLACEAQSDRTRVCLLRTGVVLAPTGGMLAKMMPLFRLGLGGPIGNGRQYLAWIHIDDMVNGILWLLDNDLSGPFNMVSLSGPQ
jgi:uncharacterized protein (TIGR01777 family)